MMMNEGVVCRRAGGDTESTIYTVVNLEQHPTTYPTLAPREQRARIVPGMFARIMMAVNESSWPRPVWVRIKIAGGTMVDDGSGRVSYDEYVGVVAGETDLDLDLGDELEFGPEHIYEWSVAPW